MVGGRARVGLEFRDGSRSTRPGLGGVAGRITATYPDTGTASLVGGIENADYAALDRILPHPVYGKELWVCVLNPSRRTFEEQVNPLVAESYERLARARRRRSRST